jgi:hypothetical protein
MLTWMLAERGAVPPVEWLRVLPETSVVIVGRLKIARIFARATELLLSWSGGSVWQAKHKFDLVVDHD